MSYPLTLLGSPGTAPGKFGQGLALVNPAGAAGTQAARVLDPGPLDITKATGWTIEGWVNQTDAPANGYRMFASCTDTSGAMGWYVGTNGGKYYFYVAGVNNPSTGAPSPVVAATTGSFRHWALVYSSGVATMYIDGVSVLSAPGTYTSPTAPVIGYLGGFVANTLYLNGILDEVRVSNVARYAAAFAPPVAAFTDDASTMALYHLDTATGLVTDSHASTVTIGAISVATAASVDTITYPAAADSGGTIEGYDLHMGTASGAENPTAIATNASPGAGSFTMPQAASGATNWYQVVARDTNGNGVVSNEVSSMGPVAPLSLPTPTYISATMTTVAITGSAANGGTGAYVYQWQRNTKAASTDAGWANVVGATSLTLTDTPPTTPIYYRLRVMDATTAVVTSQAVPAPLAQATVNALFIGNSITSGYGATALNMVQTWQAVMGEIAGVRSVGVLNRGVSGTVTADWVPGSSTGYLAAAVSAANSAYSAGSWDALVMLGTNDARSYQGGPQVSAASYRSDMASIIGYVLANGARRVIVNQDPAYLINSPGAGNLDSGIDLLRAYDGVNVGQANGSTSLTGDRTALDLFEANLAGLLGSDGLHPSQAGHTLLGTIQAVGYARATGLLGVATSAAGAVPVVGDVVRLA